MGTTEVFLIAMTLIFAVPYVVWRIGRTDYYAPLVVVQTVVGVLLGPGVLGSIYPGYYGHVFTPAVVQSLSGVAWWAVMLYVWIAGIELDLAQAWKYRRESVTTASLALGVPLLLGCGAALVVLQTGGWKGTEARSWQFVLAVGMACAVTALPVLIMLMEKLGVLRQNIGQRLLRYASLDDIAIWSVLALILMDWQRMGLQATFLLVFAVAAWLFRKLMPRFEERDRWCMAIIWLLLSAWGADRCGLHFMVGAFLAGAVMDAHWLSQKSLDQLRHNVLLILMPVYFVSTGLRTNWRVGGVLVFAVTGLLLVAATAGKLLGTHLAARVLKWGPDDARMIGWFLQTKGLIMIVFANVLLDKNLITSEMFTALLLMAVVSTMLTIPMVTPLLKRTEATVGKTA